MYIESLTVEEFRCFERAELEFQYPGRRHGSTRKPRLDNVNLLLGDNGTGKTAILKAAALAVLAQIINSAGLRPYLLVRRTGKYYDPAYAPQGVMAQSSVNLRLHPEDAYPSPEDWSGRNNEISHKRLTSTVVVERYHSIETVGPREQPRAAEWEGLFVEDSPSFFLVGYGSTRRVENAESFDSSARLRTRAARYQRIAGLFEDYVSLTPTNAWQAEIHDTQRLAEARKILRGLLPEEVQVRDYTLDWPDLPFEVRGTPLPYSVLSDGYRAFIGWVGDLLYQLSHVVPPGKMLTDLHGVVMVDELDLLLHPSWQRTVIDSLAAAFPRLQFFFTSHSPILAGALDPANIFVTSQDPVTGAVTVQPGTENIHGLSADQVLGSTYFEVSTSRSPDAVDQMKQLAHRAWEGDKQASLEFLRRLTEGFESASANGEKRRSAEK
jgi:hypothetical protein